MCTCLRRGELYIVTTVITYVQVYINIALSAKICRVFLSTDHTPTPRCAQRRSRSGAARTSVQGAHRMVLLGSAAPEPNHDAFQRRRPTGGDGRSAPESGERSAKCGEERSGGVELQLHGRALPSASWAVDQDRDRDRAHRSVVDLYLLCCLHGCLQLSSQPLSRPPLAAPPLPPVLPPQRALHRSGSR